MGRPGEAKTGTKENSQTPMGELEPIASFAQPGETDRTSNRADSIGCEQPPQTFGTDMKPFLDKNWHQHEIGHAEQAGHRNQEKDGAHLRVSPNPLHSLAQQRPCVAHIRDALPDWQAHAKVARNDGPVGKGIDQEANRQAHPTH